MTTYNIIGDIHGRTNWKELVDKTYINIFVGDFFDPYTWIPYADLRRNFLEIIAFKHKFPDNVILLYGNHDYEYLPGIFEESNRYDALNARKITNLLTDNASSFYGVAYAIGERYLVTHAGLTRPWVMKYIPEAVDFLPSKMEEAVTLCGLMTSWRLASVEMAILAIIMVKVLGIHHFGFALPHLAKPTCTVKQTLSKLSAILK